MTSSFSSEVLSDLSLLQDRPEATCLSLFVQKEDCVKELLIFNDLLDYKIFSVDSDFLPALPFYCFLEVSWSIKDSLSLLETSEKRFFTPYSGLSSFFEYLKLLEEEGYKVVKAPFVSSSFSKIFKSAAFWSQNQRFLFKEFESLFVNPLGFLKPSLNVRVVSEENGLIYEFYRVLDGKSQQFALCRLLDDGFIEFFEIDILKTQDFENLVLSDSYKIETGFDLKSLQNWLLDCLDGALQNYEVLSA